MLTKKMKYTTSIVEVSTFEFKRTNIIIERMQNKVKINNKKGKCNQ